MNFKTIAVMISKDNYDIAVASCGPKFASTPRHEVYGMILVLNDVTIHAPTDRQANFAATYWNGYMDEADFRDQYTYVDEDATPDSFCEVERI